MKSAFHTGVKEITIRRTPVPTPGPGECLVRSKPAPSAARTPGGPARPRTRSRCTATSRPASSKASGPGATRSKVGDRVVCYAIRGCGSCENCRNGIPTRCASSQFVEGGFQEYSLFTADLLFPCPEGIDFVTASLLSDAMENRCAGSGGCRPHRPIRSRSRGLGPLGLLQVLFLRARGVKQIIGLDTVEARQKKALELGADFVLDPAGCDVVAEVAKLCGGDGADKAYTFVRNAQATETAVRSTKKGAGGCTFVGLEGNFNLPEWLERTMVWSFYFTPDEYFRQRPFPAGAPDQPGAGRLRRPFPLRPGLARLSPNALLTGNIRQGSSLQWIESRLRVPEDRFRHSQPEKTENFRKIIEKWFDFESFQLIVRGVPGLICSGSYTQFLLFHNYSSKRLKKQTWNPFLFRARSPSGTGYFLLTRRLSGCTLSETERNRRIMTTPTILIDAYSQIFRAYYAIRQLNNSGGSRPMRSSSSRACC
ncbi:MAG: zinc-binding dehydrogenase [Victivallis sp.]